MVFVGDHSTPWPLHGFGFPSRVDLKLTKQRKWIQEHARFGEIGKIIDHQIGENDVDVRVCPWLSWLARGQEGDQLSTTKSNLLRGFAHLAFGVSIWGRGEGWVREGGVDRFMLDGEWGDWFIHAWGFGGRHWVHGLAFWVCERGGKVYTIVRRAIPNFN